jgi:glycosyltransferase involved in cell wall biosynthesis
MKIVSMSLYYKPIWPGFGVRVPQLILDEAAKNGHDVILYTGRIPKEMQVEEKHRLKKFVDKMGKGQVEIHRLWTPDIKHEGILKRTEAYSIFIIQCFFKVLFSKNIDLLIGLHPYPPFFISILILAKLKNIKFFLHQGDLWPDNLLELGIIKNSFIFSIIKKISVWAFNLADIVVVITDELKRGMAKYPIPQSKIKVLELATDTELFRPITSVVDRYGGKFVVLYNGIFSPNYDFDIILSSAELLKDTDILFVIAGAGELKDCIKNEIEKRLLKNVIMEEPLKDIEDVVKKINRADVLLLGMNDNLQANTAHPSKLFEFMACGKPVVCSGRGATRDLINKSGGALLVDPGDSRSFANAILKLQESENLRQILGEKGRSYVLKHHSLEVFRNNLASILDSFNHS